MCAVGGNPPRQKSGQRANTDSGSGRLLTARAPPMLRRTEKRNGEQKRSERHDRHGDDRRGCCVCGCCRRGGRHGDRGRDHDDGHRDLQPRVRREPLIRDHIKEGVITAE
jgi:hypothetical protein